MGVDMFNQLTFLYFTSSILCMPLSTPRSPRHLSLCFVASDHYLFYSLSSSAGETPKNILENLQDLLSDVGNVESVRIPYAEEDLSGRADVLGGTVVRLTKTYRWWLSDPFIALLLIAGIIILICIVTLIILGISWSRSVSLGSIIKQGVINPLVPGFVPVILSGAVLKERSSILKCLLLHGFLPKLFL